MFENIPDYIKDIVTKTSKNDISKEKFELYQEETRLLAKIKRDFENQFKNAIENNVPTSTRKEI